jgi:hypothetical protein
LSPKITSILQGQELAVVDEIFKEGAVGSESESRGEFEMRD